MMYTLGTVCKLKGIDLDILIIGYNGKSPTNGYVYEYVGCLLDEGYIDSDESQVNYDKLKDIDIENL